MDNSDKIRSLLSSYDEWETLGDKLRPYVFKIEKGTQILTYIGATHSRNPLDVQFEIIEKEWGSFLEVNSSSKLVLVEGGLRPISLTKEGSIIENSEAGFVTFLAEQKNLEVMCPEPDRGEERKELLKYFTKEEIQYYYFARVLPSWFEKKKVKDISLHEQLEKYKQGLKEGIDDSWSGFDFSIEHMKIIHKNIFHEEFDENNIDFIKKVINPTTEYSIINKVARASSIYRDLSIVSSIVNQWEQGKSLFVVMGFAHAVIQEKALRQLLV
jgi:hypothetical protein